jgi:hypothetical protein
MKYFLTILAAACLLVSCTPENLELDVPQAPERIAVASQLSPPGTDYFILSLSRTFSALSSKKPSFSDSAVMFPEELLVRGADVTLSIHGMQIGLQELSPGVYYTDQVSRNEYADYTLTVTDNEKGQSLVASAQLMPSVTFDTVGVDKVAGKDKEYLIHYSITDIPGINNWYVVNYYTKDNRKDSLPSNPADIDYIAKRMLEQRLDFDLISQDDIVNGRYSVTKRFTNERLDTFAIALSNISQGYYDFLKAQKKYHSLINQIRGEVVNLPSNVQGGYGYFNMHTPDVRVFDLSHIR